MRVFRLAVIWMVVLGLPATALADMDPKYSCLDHSSRQVTVVKAKDRKAPAVEASYTFRGLPVLNVNFHALAAMKPSPLMQEFMYFRECGRHVLGFVVNPATTVSEQRRQTSLADCWAVNRLYYYNGTDKVSVMNVQEMLNTLPRGHWQHFPGPMRIVDFPNNCYLR
ncbi:hypothetical protein [Nitrospina watsonii]|uniref:Uncharacterized protein n=1 Tax=Nitrospina watsonii TaxID=1323948 RepID=A0ABM9HAB5_9BACT|nr:hypothetical protein [Nitrospina watsonii]CAI2717087.1 conserved exported protein of unknown function [Nitrospina watsonii]